MRRRLFEEFVLILGIASGVLGLRCEKTPPEVTKPRRPGDGDYSLEIFGDPSSYTPGNSYKIILKGATSHHDQRRFTNFLLIAEPNNPEDHSQHNNSLGTLQLYGDMLTQYSDRCPNAVVHTNSVGKTQIQVMWTAPSNGSGCVAFRATVVESSDKWYSEDDELTKVLCEESQDNEDFQPPVIQECCACHEAKYEVTFEGLWSRNTHPKDFPKNNWITRFSDIIGASHTVNYTFWNYGDIASEGLRQLAENGNTRELESELKDKSGYIRTIIKARGISYPNITGKTFAVFRVDKKHHLMSLVSMIHPSPDWIVGVSSLELCLRNCSWVESKTLNLYPWDVGTDDGKTYISKDLPSNPRAPIRRLTSSWPNDVESPFYDDSGAEMKPLARLILSRQRLYEKNCNADGDTYIDPKTEGYCDITDWSEWSSCSARCGKGMRHKQRRYKNQDPDYARQQSYCKKALTKRSSCKAKMEKCSLSTGHEEDCDLSPWGQWSSCSATCGEGTKTRSRNYKTKTAGKVCPFKFNNSPVLQENLPCFDRECESGEEIDEISEECQERSWSDWSPCSTTCGKGVKIRKKLPFIRSKKHQRNKRNYDEEDDEDVEDIVDTCDHVMERVECHNELHPECEEVVNPAIACASPMEVGLCRSFTDRWYYNSYNGKCELFAYSGCEGNANNFRTLETCERVCGTSEETKPKKTSRHLELSMFQMQNDEPQYDNDLDGRLESLDQVKYSNDVIDCEVSEWTQWSPCDATCGKGYKYKSRFIYREPENGGKKCPQKLLKKRKCKVQCNKITDNSSEFSFDIDCVLDDWSRWSPCSHTCGPDAMRQRTRNIKVKPTGNGKPCGERIEIEPCNLSACHVY